MGKSLKMNDIPVGKSLWESPCGKVPVGKSLWENRVVLK